DREILQIPVCVRPEVFADSLGMEPAGRKNQQAERSEPNGHGYPPGNRLYAVSHFSPPSVSASIHQFAGLKSGAHASTFVWEFLDEDGRSIPRKVAERRPPEHGARLSECPCSATSRGSLG